MRTMNHLYLEVSKGTLYKVRINRICQDRESLIAHGNSSALEEKRVRRSMPQSRKGPHKVGQINVWNGLFDKTNNHWVAGIGSWSYSLHRCKFFMRENHWRSFVGGGGKGKPGHAYKCTQTLSKQITFAGCHPNGEKRGVDFSSKLLRQSQFNSIDPAAPGCPDVPFSRHSRFHPLLLPCHILIYLNSPHPCSILPFIAHGTIYSPEITGLPTAGQSIAIQPSLRDTTSSTRENYVDFFLWHKKTFVTIYLNL